MATGFVVLIGNLAIFVVVSLLTRPVDPAVLDQLWGTVYQRRISAARRTQPVQV